MVSTLTGTEMSARLNATRLPARRLKTYHATKSEPTPKKYQPSPRIESDAANRPGRVTTSKEQRPPKAFAKVKGDGQDCNAAQAIRKFMNMGDNILHRELP